MNYKKTIHNYLIQVLIHLIMTGRTFLTKAQLHQGKKRQKEYLYDLIL